MIINHPIVKFFESSNLKPHERIVPIIEAIINR